MASAMNIALDSISAILLLLMLFDFGNHKECRYDYTHLLFDTMLCLNLALLFMDGGMWYLDGKRFGCARTLNFLVTDLYYFLEPIMTMVWCIYCRYIVDGARRPHWARLLILSIPTVFAAVLLIVNFYHPCVFTIDASNRYTRGPYMWLFVAITYGYLAYFFAVTIKTIRAQTGYSKTRPMKLLLIYPVFPTIGAIIQLSDYGVSLIWSASMVSLLIMYFERQHELITTDSLTGLSNRRRFEVYLDGMTGRTSRAGLLFLVMIDVDKFKQINDGFGHAVGDHALCDVADILKESFQRDDFIARIGGDEFCVVGERDSEVNIWRALSVLDAVQRDFNRRKSAPYSLFLSCGCAIFEKDGANTAKEMFEQADRRMYRQKASET